MCERERVKNSQQECEILTNVRFSRMSVCERVRERGNFFFPRILCNSGCFARNHKREVSAIIIPSHVM
jgi:hypothetical protein